MNFNTFWKTLANSSGKKHCFSNVSTPSSSHETDRCSSSGYGSFTSSNYDSSDEINDTLQKKIMFTKDLNYELIQKYAKQKILSHYVDIQSFDATKEVMLYNENDCFLITIIQSFLHCNSMKKNLHDSRKFVLNDTNVIKIFIDLITQYYLKDCNPISFNQYSSTLHYQFDLRNRVDLKKEKVSSIMIEYLTFFMEQISKSFNFCNFDIYYLNIYNKTDISFVKSSFNPYFMASLLYSYHLEYNNWLRVSEYIELIISNIPPLIVILPCYNEDFIEEKYCQKNLFFKDQKYILKSLICCDNRRPFNILFDHKNSEFVLYRQYSRFYDRKKYKKCISVIFYELIK